MGGGGGSAVLGTVRLPYSTVNRRCHWHANRQATCVSQSPHSTSSCTNACTPPPPQTHACVLWADCHTRRSRGHHSRQPEVGGAVGAVAVCRVEVHALAVLGSWKGGCIHAALCGRSVGWWRETKREASREGSRQGLSESCLTLQNPGPPGNL